MTGLEHIAGSIELITFDCYGTLIDWSEGIGRTLTQISGLEGDALASLVEDCIRQEALLESGAYQSYKNIQSAVMTRLAESHGFELSEDQRNALSQSLPDWKPFADTNRALSRLKKKYRLGVLSNIDRDLLAGTCRQFDVKFDLIITAEDVRSYKPAHPHFLTMLSSPGVRRDAVLHVAQSLYHDAVPAGQLSIPFVWINRYGGTRQDQPMLAEFATLEALADALGASDGKRGQTPG